MRLRDVKRLRSFIDGPVLRDYGKILKLFQVHDRSPHHHFTQAFD